MVNYSIIIPVYNGQDTVQKLFERIKLFFYGKEYTYEVIFIYDCGEDNSWQVLKELKHKNSDTIKLVRLSRNFGQHNALICGFQFSNGNFVITMDEDLQQDPFDIQKLIEKQKENDFDLVYGKFEFKKHNTFRNFTSALLKLIIRIGIPEIHKDYSAFRLIKNRIIKETVVMQNSYTFLDGYLSWITTNVDSVSVSHSNRVAGKSGYNVHKLINHSINIFVTFSNWPIRLLTKLSLIVILTDLVFVIYIILRKIFISDFAIGYPSIIVAIGLGFGLTLFSLSIIGEYIYRINLKTTKRPNYSVSEIL